LEHDRADFGLATLGIHGCDLDDWLQAERKLQEKYNKSKDGGPKKK